jgi:competence CoiA-like predicted nuclease
MLTARTTTKNYVEASRDLQKDKFFCRFCDGEAVFKNGPVKIPHFAHKNDGCPNGQGESEVHRKIKTALYNNLIAEGYEPGVNVFLEADIQEVKRCADVLFVNDDQIIALEVQKTKINADEIDQRTADYNNHNIAVVWIAVDTYNNAQRNVPALHKHFHKMHNGQMFVMNEQSNNLRVVHFEPAKTWVEETEFYDSDEGEVVQYSGYWKYLKRARECSVSCWEISPSSLTYTKNRTGQFVGCIPYKMRWW